MDNLLIMVVLIDVLAFIALFSVLMKQEQFGASPVPLLVAFIVIMALGILFLNARANGGIQWTFY
jgi:hypothetical protein